MQTGNFTQNLLSIQNDLFTFACKLTSDIEEANDLLQETSLKALDSEDKYVHGTNFKGWMYTLMRNIFINSYRKTVRNQSFVDYTESIQCMNQSFDVEGESTDYHCDSKEIRKIINSLPKEYRIPFSMYVAGFKYKEISDKLGISIGTVKSRIFTTRQKLQQELRDFR